MLFHHADFSLTEAKDGDGVGTIMGYASTFGNTDRVGDVVNKGAFKGSKAANVMMFWNHNSSDVIGGWTKIEEDDKGLYVEGELNLDVTRGREAYALLKRGHLKSMSIGYRIPPNGAKYDPSGIRQLVKVDLIEVSLVAVPANPKAMITRTKGVPDVRELEHWLSAEAGLSRAEAKRLISGGYTALRAEGERDAASGLSEGERDAADETPKFRDVLNVLNSLNL